MFHTWQGLAEYVMEAAREMLSYQINSSWLGYEPCHIYWKLDETQLNVMIKSNESAAGKIIMKLQACLMILSISGEEEFHRTRRNLRGILQTLGRNYAEGLYCSYFKKRRGHYFVIISSRKCQAKCLSLKWFFLHVSHTGITLQKKSSEDSLPSIIEKKSFISLSS